MHLELENLKNIAEPADVRQKFFEKTTEFAPENRLHNRIVRNKILHPESIILDLHADSKAGVLRELIDQLVKNGILKDADSCFEELMRRENAASTCFQNGIAMPHCRTASVRNPVVAVGISKKGYYFDSMDGKPTQIFLLCLSPENDVSPHIECLATFGSILSDTGNIKKTLNADTVIEVYNIFRQ